MILRSTVTSRQDPLAPTHAVGGDDLNLVPCARHARRHPDRPAHGEPLPGSWWALVLLVAWAMAALTTLLSVAIYGGERNGLWLVAVVFYAVGIGALLRGWGRL